MSIDPYARTETLGLWMPAEGWIVIKRGELRDLTSFAGTLLHELTHAKYGVGDVSRDFELNLTNLIGELSARLLR